MAACVLHNCLRNDHSVGGSNIESNDPTLQSHYFTFHHLGENVGEGAISVREK